MTARASPSWNPLRCDGTTLPPGWLLAAKLLAFWLFPGTRFLAAGPPFLPFFPVLDAPFLAAWLAPLTAAAFWVAFLSLMVSRFVQPACLVIAGCLLYTLPAIVSRTPTTRCSWPCSCCSSDCTTPGWACGR